jgi:hypothetical protein
MTDTAPKTKPQDAPPSGDAPKAEGGAPAPTARGGRGRPPPKDKSCCKTNAYADLESSARKRNLIKPFVCFPQVILFFFITLL